LSDVTPVGEQHLDDDDRRRRGWGIFDRWGNAFKFTALLLIIAAIGAGAWMLGSSNSKGVKIYVEAADSVGMDPFTTEGIAPTPAEATDSSSTTGLFGGSGDNGICAPDKLVAFLESSPDKAAAWVAALNADPTLSWSGGNNLQVSDIAAYVAELTPTFLNVDTPVTNQGFKDGEPTPRQSLLEKGTAVLVDKDGVPRVRCYCGNPLNPPDDDTTTTDVMVTEGEETTTSTEGEETTTSIEGEETTTSIEGEETTTSIEGDIDFQPECESIGAMPTGATDITTAPVDYNADGTPDVLRVYRLGSVWHVRAEIGGSAVADDVLVGPGPTMAAIGGATVDSFPGEEAWVKVGSGSSTDIIGLLMLLDCDLKRVLLGGTDADANGSLTQPAHHPAPEGTSGRPALSRSGAGARSEAGRSRACWQTSTTLRRTQTAAAPRSRA